MTLRHAAALVGCTQMHNQGAVRMKITAKALLLALALTTAAGCSASSGPIQMPDGTQCKVSSHFYPWGGYVNKICTDTKGNTTTTRTAQSGLYD